jgi:uncharacterized protein (TIGR03084 family)
MNTTQPFLQQAHDFRDESDAIYNVLSTLSDEEFKKETLFKKWTFNDIIGHLHVWNYAANISLVDEDQFNKYSVDALKILGNGGSIREFEQTILKKINGKDLLMLWKDYYSEVANNFTSADPKKRVKWMGPDMSARSSITARLMETWSHSQALYDALGIKRENKDRIKNIVVLGNNTFKWCYTVHGKPLPDETPYLKLTAPSGDVWEFNNKENENKIEGLAEEFCQVVAQVRNIKDVNLKVTGEIANQWMSIAQCFAGPPEQPPKPGHRRINT